MLELGARLSSQHFGELTVQKELGEGGQGTVFSVRTPSGSYALKWYAATKDHERQAIRKKSFQELVAKGPPPNPVGVSKCFAWPLDIVEGEDGGVGYVMDLIDTKKFFKLGYVQKKHTEQPNLRPNLASLCELSFQLAHCFRALHLTGHSYRDISDGNIFFDPSTGDIVIIDNDNVGVDGVPVLIAGTPRYMAPEIVVHKVTPSTQTDQYSLAVLLFLFWVWHHPLEGTLKEATPCFGPKEQQQLYGANPCFIFDPHNTSNCITADQGYDTARDCWKMCPQTIREKFIEAFTIGLRNPMRRVTEGTWERVFLSVKDGATQCRKCGAEVFLDIQEKSGSVCWKCSHRIPSPAKLVLERNGTRTILPLTRSTKVYRHHIDPTGGISLEKHHAVLGEITIDPKNPKVWGLRNMSQTNWDVQFAGESPKQLPPGRAVPLRSTTGIYIEGAKLRVEPPA